MKKIWFPAKKYGWGWGFPCCWQGRLVLLIYLAAAGILPLVFHPHHDAAAFYTALTLLTALLLLICCKKGDKPRWRWGGKN